MNAVTTSEITKEIEQVIEELDAENVRALYPDVITEKVIARWDEDAGDHYLCCTNAFVRDQVRQRMNRYKVKSDPNPDKQLVLEGWERLQKRYFLREDNRDCAIRVQEMTFDQLMAKAREHRAMGDGHYQHASELERYARSLSEEAG